MSVSYFERLMGNLFDFKQPHAGKETDNMQILEEINRELEAYLARDSNDQDLTDGVLTSCRQSPTQYKRNLMN